MALFGGRRDISLFRKLNRELVNRWIQQEMGIYKLALDHTNTNVYGESDQKVYHRPVLVIGIVNRDGQQFAGNEFGQDYTTSATFAFLIDDLKKLDLYPEVGDIIVWDNEYYELDSVIENQYFAGKNPGTSISNNYNYGWDVSMVFGGHVTRRSRLNLVDERTSPPTQDYDLPPGV